MKARYLAQAYQIAIEEMPFKTWNECCHEAINQLASVHINYIKNEKVLRRWNVEFCKKKTFCVKSRGKRDLPAFLEAHPIVVTVMKEYGRENLSELSVEMMHTYLHNTIIKSLVIERLQGKCRQFMMVKRIQWARSGMTRVFDTSCPTSRTLRPKKQCFNSRPWRWGYQWTGHQNAIVSLLGRGLNMHGDARRITSDDNL
jgi:hypothetical protein